MGDDVTIVDWTSESSGVLALSMGNGVDENDGALVEDCRSFGGVPTTLNNLDKVSAGCTAAVKISPRTSADVLAGVVPLEASECSTVVDRNDGRVANVDRAWLGGLTVEASAAGLLLDTMSGVDCLAGVVEEVATKAEVSGLAAIGDIINEEYTGVGVEDWLSAGIEGVSVWLRNRATL